MTQRILPMGLTCAAVLAACGGGEFSAQEMSDLGKLKIDALLASPSNKYADDPKAAVIGQKFYWDSRFSGPLQIASDLGRVGEAGKVSCASCHDPANGGTDHRSLPGNTSLGSGFTGRNAPTVVNSGYCQWMFWDGRKDSVWSQALGPVESGVEHNFSRIEVVRLIADKYKIEFEEVFGAGSLPAEISILPLRGKPGDAQWATLTPGQKDLVSGIYARFGKAIEAYERKLVSKDSAFDRFLEGETMAMTAAQKRGAKLFVGKAACTECHSGPNFVDDKYHNTGVTQDGPNLPAVDTGRQAGIAKVQGDEFNRNGAFSDEKSSTHLTPLAPDAETEGQFKTPSLRDVSKSAPYMHTGSLKTLSDVMHFYKDGGHKDGFGGTKDKAMARLMLTDSELDDLVDFMKALDGVALPEALVTRPSLP